jgi:ankyrin repeat protein
MAPKQQAVEDKVATLHKLIKKGDVDGVTQLVKSHPDLVNSESKAGMTPLGAAIERNDHSVVEALLAAGADPNVAGKGCDGQAPLLLACWSNDDASAQILVNAGADPNVFDAAGRSCLHACCSVGAMGLLEFLVKPDSDNAKKLDIASLMLKADRDGMTAMHFLCSEVHTSSRAGDLFDFLVSSTPKEILAVCLGMQTNDRKLTPFAALVDGAEDETVEHIQRVDTLIAKGAAVTLADRDGVTPLFTAIKYGHLRVVKSLVNRLRELNVLPEQLNGLDTAKRNLADYVAMSDVTLSEVAKLVPEMDCEDLERKRKTSTEVDEPSMSTGPQPSVANTVQPPPKPQGDYSGRSAKTPAPVHHAKKESRPAVVPRAAARFDGRTWSVLLAFFIFCSVVLPVLKAMMEGVGWA